MPALLATALPKGTYSLTTLPATAVRNKLSNLQRLAELSRSLDFSVPPTYVIDASHFMDALDNVLPGAPERLRPDALDQQLAGYIRERLLAHPLPRGTQRALRAIYNAYRREVGEGALCVRSCFELEDLPDHSLAGCFESVHQVSTLDTLYRAVQAVYASVFSGRAIHDLRAISLQALPAMSVALQPMIGGEGWLGGVAHTQSPDLQPFPLMLISVARDSAAVTSGSVIPEDYLVDCDRLERPGERVIAQVQSGTRTTDCFALSDAQVRDIATALVRLEEGFDGPLEVEWLLDHKGGLHLLQARSSPVAADPQVLGTPLTEDPPLVQGLAVGHGHCSAPIVLAKDPEEASRAPPGSILVTRSTDPDWVPAIRRAAGVVTRVGGRTSHVARSARESGILAVVGGGASVDKLRPGQTVTLFCAEGLNGAVYPGKVEAEQVLPSTDRVDIHHVTTAFTLARSCRPATAALHVDSLIRAFRLPPANFSSDELEAHVMRRIAGYCSVFDFVHAKLLEAACLTRIAFPDARLTLMAPETSPWSTLLSPVIAAARREYGLTLTAQTAPN